MSHTTYLRRRALKAVSSGELSYRFESSRSEGAILVPGDITKKVCLSEYLKTIKDYVVQNHRRWHAFAKSLDLECQPEDIIFVRGTVKTSSWIVAAYWESRQQMSALLTGRASQFVNVAFSWTHGRSTSGRSEHRYGPRSRAQLGPIQPSESSGHHTPNELVLPEVLAEDRYRRMEREIASDFSVTQAADQCIFLSCYKVKYRAPLPMKLVAAAGYDEIHPSRDGSSSSPVLARSQTDGSMQAEIECEPPVSKVSTF